MRSEHPFATERPPGERMSASGLPPWCSRARSDRGARPWRKEATVDALAKRLVMLCLLGLLCPIWHLTGIQVAAALEVGDTAPDFTLPATTGGNISLSQFRGKKMVLLEFIVHDFGPV